MALNLSRNSRLWVSTVDSGNDNSNTFEIPLQDGFSFSQAMTSEDVNVEEAGPTPTRGTKRFNSTLDPVEWSFSTYICPYLWDTDKHMVVDALLWHALASGSTPDLSGDTLGGIGDTPIYAGSSAFNVAFSDNSHHVLTELFLFFKVDNQVFKIHGSQVNQAELSVDITDIGQITWSGQGTRLETVSAPAFISGSGLDYVSVGATADEYVQVPATKQYLLNKLTVMEMTSDVSPTAAPDDNYAIALTGASLTINNNVSFVTPSTLSVVDLPIGSFTGSFEVTGTVDSYLKSTNGDGSIGTEYGSQELLEHMLDDRRTATASAINFFIGGKTSPVAEITIPNAQIAIPAVSIEAVVSQSFEFKAMPTTADLDDGNEIALAFKAV